MKEFARNTLLALLTTLLVWLAFPPADLGALAWIALVPWLLVIARARPRTAALCSFIAAYFLFLLLAHWLRYVTIAGWFTLALYCALYLPVGGLLIAWLRRRGIPFVLSAPLLLTLLDFIRANLFTGFPFFFTGHTQYRYLPIIQIADITGVYGITFLIGMVNGCIADLLLQRRAAGRRLVAMMLPPTIVAALALAVVGYGLVRLNHLQLTPGPKVALIQGNIPQDLKHSPDEKDALSMLDLHVELSRQAAAEKPDLIIWPETMFPAPMNHITDPAVIQNLLVDSDEDYRKYGRYLLNCKKALELIARETGSYLLVGAETSGRAGRFNSAYLFSPAAREVGRYDKIHLVIFGEYVPLLDLLPFLKVFRPEVMGEDLTPGRTRTLLTVPMRDGRASEKFGITICYEDAEADLFRQFVRDGARFMINTTNDGWFRDSTELNEHLAICAFRAVETRVPIARCANTGISAIIAPDGRICQQVTDNQGRRREVRGILVGTLSLSNLTSFYAAHGNLFAWLCVLGTAVVLVTAVFRKPPALAH